MCLGIPGRVVELLDGYDGQLALVDIAGEHRRVNVGMLPEETFAPGDWVIVHMGFVVEKTDAAATKLRELTAEETNPQIGLRVYVYSGGCSGFRYGMMLEDAPTPEDRVLQANGVTVYVDGNSVDLLQGSSIDYVDTLMGAGFTVNNPNAVAACGCGSSFRTADDAGTARACAH